MSRSCFYIVYNGCITIWALFTKVFTWWFHFTEKLKSCLLRTWQTQYKLWQDFNLDFFLVFIALKSVYFKYTTCFQIFIATLVTISDPYFSHLSLYSLRLWDWRYCNGQMENSSCFYSDRNAVALADGTKISLMESSLVPAWEVQVPIYGGVVVVMMDMH